MTIAILDVYYLQAGARSACVLAESWQAEQPLSTHAVDIPAVEDYEPGQFYRRELPCLLAVLGILPVPPDVIVVDGYVWLPEGAKKGLGAHLHVALDARVPVIGVAKTAFAGDESSPRVAQILRGDSAKPLFVTAAGVEIAKAAEWIRGMAGPYRIPALLTLADQLSRNGALVASTTRA